MQVDFWYLCCSIMIRTYLVYLVLAANSSTPVAAKKGPRLPPFTRDVTLVFDSFRNTGHAMAFSKWNLALRVDNQKVVSLCVPQASSGPISRVATWGNGFEGTLKFESGQPITARLEWLEESFEPKVFTLEIDAETDELPGEVYHWCKLLQSKTSLAQLSFDERAAGCTAGNPTAALLLNPDGVRATRILPMIRGGSSGVELDFHGCKNGPDGSRHPDSAHVIAAIENVGNANGLTVDRVADLDECVNYHINNFPAKLPRSRLHLRFQIVGQIALDESAVPPALVATVTSSMVLDDLQWVAAP